MINAPTGLDEGQSKTGFLCQTERVESVCLARPRAGFGSVARFRFRSNAPRRLVSPSSTLVQHHHHLALPFAYVATISLSTYTSSFPSTIMFALRSRAALRAPSSLRAVRAIATSTPAAQAQAVENSNASAAPATKKEILKKFSIYRWVRFHHYTSGCRLILDACDGSMESTTSQKGRGGGGNVVRLLSVKVGLGNDIALPGRRFASLSGALLGKSTCSRPDTDMIHHPLDPS